jgi:REP element-mobilizing transposase RayT
MPVALCSDVTAPRQVLEGATYLVTRRVSERRFFLRPSKEATSILGFILGVVSERYGVLLHAVCALSNHLHIVLTDPHARLPDFQRDLDSLVARALNCSLGRWESVFERDSYSAVRLETRDDVLDKMVYVLANPVAAGLVRRGTQWPGLWSDPRHIGSPGTVVERPKGFFRENGPMPARAVLKLHAPPGFENDRELVEEVVRRLEKAEDRAAAAITKQGRSFMGVARVLAQKWYARPRGGEPRRGLSPHVACRNKWKRNEAISRLIGFREAYREALAKWKDGQRDVTFPPGTWLMRVQHGVRSVAAV